MSAKQPQPSDSSSQRDNPFRALPSVDEALRLLESALAAPPEPSSGAIPRAVLAEIVSTEMDAVSYTHLTLPTTPYV